MATVRFPRLLDPATGGRRSLTVAGDTLQAVLTAMVVEIPAVEVHLFDNTGALRPHVLCFVDGEPTRLNEREISVKPASEVRFLQAVSGGS